MGIPECWAESTNENDGVGVNEGFGIRLKARKMAG